MHAGRDACSQQAHGAEEVGPGIAALDPGGLHGAGEHDRHTQAEKQEGQSGGAVGQGVGAVQDQHRIAAILLDTFDYGVTHGQPVGLGHIGAVQQRQQFAECPGRSRALGLGGLLGT
ncbi:hypothetical protein D9M68_828250 [compost metagenome]